MTLVYLFLCCKRPEELCGHLPPNHRLKQFNWAASFLPAAYTHLCLWGLALNANVIEYFNININIYIKCWAAQFYFSVREELWNWNYNNYQSLLYRQSYRRCPSKGILCFFQYHSVQPGVMSLCPRKAFDLSHPGSRGNRS